MLFRSPVSMTQTFFSSNGKTGVGVGSGTSAGPPGLFPRYKSTIHNATSSKILAVSFIFPFLAFLLSFMPRSLFCQFFCLSNYMSHPNSFMSNFSHFPSQKLTVFAQFDTLKLSFLWHRAERDFASTGQKAFARENFILRR